MTTSCYRMQVALAQEDVVDALEFHGAAILGLEQHRITNLNASDIRPDGNDLGPTQPASYLGCCGNDDAATRSTLTVLSAFSNEDSIMKQLDRNGSI